jgi:hypothetical protein
MAELKSFVPSRLQECSEDDIRQATAEVAIMSISSLLPIWLCLLFSLITLRWGDFGDFLSDYIVSGDVLLTSCALIGPVMYILWKKYGEELPDRFTIRFPYGLMLSASIVGIGISSAAAFGYTHIESAWKVALQPTAPLANRISMGGFSLLILVASIVILFIATALRNSTEKLDAAKLMRESDADFLQGWSK